MFSAGMPISINSLWAAGVEGPSLSAADAVGMKAPRISRGVFPTRFRNSSRRLGLEEGSEFEVRNNLTLGASRIMMWCGQQFDVARVVSKTTLCVTHN